MVKTGLERITDFTDVFAGKKVGLIINQAGVDSQFQSALQVFKQLKIDIKVLFGPQHGLFGHTQDNMIEWRGDEYGDDKIPVYSLYGKERKPTTQMLRGLDALVFDIPDVGARYYTFIWTMALSMEAALENNLQFIVLDRPNPINGHSVEGPALNPDFRSFVGLYPLPVRHGMTIGEIARWLHQRYFEALNLEIIPMQGWQRSMYFDETGLSWVVPSPNMPSLNTALVYPGQCLLEATNISEGRGTTRPFEIFGAPWIEHERLCGYLNENCPGAYFQPWYFQPTFHKYTGQLCRGAFIHVTDRERFRPLATSMTILSWIRDKYPDKFTFNDPPYEYEYKKIPIDILLGDKKWRKELEKGKKTAVEWSELWREDEDRWKKERINSLLY